MIQRQGSGIRAGRFFAFESSLRVQGNTASELDGLLVAAMLFAASRPGQREEMHEGQVPPLRPRADAPPGARPAPREAL